MGDINIDVNAIKDADNKIVEIANEIRDVTIRTNQLQWTYVSKFLGVSNLLVRANEYTNNASNRATKLRNLLKNATIAYERTEIEIGKMIEGEEYAKKDLNNRVMSMSVTEMSAYNYNNWRVETINEREEEEDYGYSVQYYYNDGTVETNSYYKRYEREYVGGKYDQNTGDLISYDVRKQYIGRGQSTEYTFSDNTTYKEENYSNVKNYYDGKEKEKVKTAEHDVKNEYIKNMTTVEVVEENRASIITEKDGTEQILTNWDLENSEVKVGKETGKVSKETETEIQYLEGENLTEDLDNWKSRSSVNTSESVLVTNQKGYLSADMLTAEAGAEIEYTAAEVSTKYEIKGEDSVHTFEADVKSGNAKANIEGKLSVLNGKEQVNLSVYGAGELEINGAKTELKYTEEDFSGNKLDSASIEITFFGAGASKKAGFKDNQAKFTYDAPIKGPFGISGSGSVDLVNRVYNQEELKENFDYIFKKNK